MDVDLLKSATEDHQMDILMMMMQMEKLPEFCESYPEVSELPSINDFSCGTTPPIFDNPHANSPTLINPPSSLSFIGNTVQEPVAPAILSNGMAGRLRNEGELLGANTFASSSQKRNSMAAMREMIFRMAAMQPIHIDPESVKPPKRRNVKISKDPQSVAARHRRERISERIRILQRLVPGGTKMDTASMLDEAIHYVKFLKTQVKSLEQAAANRPMSLGYPNYSYLAKAYPPAQMFNLTQMLS